jgi:hypothetical protein
MLVPNYKCSTQRLPSDIFSSPNLGKVDILRVEHFNILFELGAFKVGYLKEICSNLICKAQNIRTLPTLSLILVDVLLYPNLHEYKANCESQETYHRYE